MRGAACTATLLFSLNAAASGPDVKANGYLDSRTTSAHNSKTSLLPTSDLAQLQELLEGNVQLKITYSEKGFEYTDLSVFFQKAGLFQEVTPWGGVVPVPVHDVPAYRNLLSVNELYLSQGVVEHLDLLVGRKRIVWGPGLADNPTDVINPPKDPTDPSAQRAGAWLAQVQAPFDDFTITALWAPGVLYTYGGLPAAVLKYPGYPPYETVQEQQTTGQNALYPDPRDPYTHQLAALRAYALVANSDLNLMYYWSNLYNDAFTNKSRLGFSFSRYFFTDYEFHVEGLLQTGTSRLYSCGAAQPGAPNLNGIAICSNLGPVSFRELDSSTLYARLLFGTRTMFRDESALSIEYLYEGDGYNATDFANYVLLLKQLPDYVAAQLGVANRPGGTNGQPQKFTFEPLRRHYLFLEYTKPKIHDDWTVALFLLMDLEDTSGLISPSISWSATEWLTLSAFAFVTFPGLASQATVVEGKAYSEYGLAPQNFRLMFEARLFY